MCNRDLDKGLPLLGEEGFQKAQEHAEMQFFSSVVDASVDEKGETCCSLGVVSVASQLV